MGYMHKHLELIEYTQKTFIWASEFASKGRRLDDGIKWRAQLQTQCSNSNIKHVPWTPK